MYIYIHICIYIYTYTYVCIHTFIYHVNMIICRKMRNITVCLVWYIIVCVLFHTDLCIYIYTVFLLSVRLVRGAMKGTGRNWNKATLRT